MRWLTFRMLRCRERTEAPAPNELSPSEEPGNSFTLRHQADIAVHGRVPEGGPAGVSEATLRPMRWWDIAGGVLALEQELFEEDAWSAELFWSREA